MTVGFQTPLRVELVDGRWEVLEDLRWRGSAGDRIVVPAGTRTDFASVPRLLQWLLPSAAAYVVRAAVVHDRLCDLINAGIECGFTPVDADAVFEKIMRDEGASWLASRIGWVGVRWGALGNPARRPGWLSTAPRLAVLSTLLLAIPVFLIRKVVLR